MSDGTSRLSTLANVARLLFWVLLILILLSQWLGTASLEKKRSSVIEEIQKSRGSRVITLIHRQETVNLFGVAVNKSIGLVLGNVDFANFFAVLKEGTVPGPYPTLADAQKVSAVMVNYGVFVNTIISFIIVAFAVFLLIRKINKLKRKKEAPPAEPMATDCPYCLLSIPVKATRCPHSTSELGSI